MDATRSEVPASFSFWPRLLRAAALLMAAVATHIWVIRPPEAARPRIEAVAVARASGPAGSAPERRVTIVHENVLATMIVDSATNEAPGARDAATPEPPLLASSGPAGFARRDGPATEIMTDGIDDPVAVGTSGTGGEERSTRGDSGVRGDVQPPTLPSVTAALPSRDLGSSFMPTLRPAALPASTAPPRVEETVASAPPRTDEAAERSRQKEVVLQIVREYTRAVERLDVRAAKALRPSLDDRALQKAFHGLDGQEFRMAPCGVSITGHAAYATCTTDVTYRPKVGSRLRLTEREWTFNLSRNDSGWQIVDATIQ